MPNQSYTVGKNIRRNITAMFYRDFHDQRMGDLIYLFLAKLMPYHHIFPLVKWQKVGFLKKNQTSPLFSSQSTVFIALLLTTARLVFQSRAKQVSTIFLKKCQIFVILLMEKYNGRAPIQPKTNLVAFKIVNTVFFSLFLFNLKFSIKTVYLCF